MLGFRGPRRAHKMTGGGLSTNYLKGEKKEDEDYSNDSKYFKLFNARNAKFVAAGAVSLILVYHSLLWLSFGTVNIRVYNLRWLKQTVAANDWLHRTLWQ